MLEVNLSADLSRFDNLTRQLSKQEVARALSAALNRALSTGNAEVNREIRNKFRIPTSLLSQNKKSNSAPSTLTASLSLSRKPISLTYFSPVFKRGNSVIRVKGKKLTKTITRSRSTSDEGGVTVEIKKGERKRIPYAFMINNNSSKPVFARGAYEGSGGAYTFKPRHKRLVSSGSDLPIAKLLSTSVFGAIQNGPSQSAVQGKVATKLDERVVRELTFRINRAG